MVLLLLLFGALLPACGGGNIFSSTVWAGPLPLDAGVVVLATRDNRVVAASLEDGRPLWTFTPASQARRGGFFNFFSGTRDRRDLVRGIYGTPATDGSLVYVASFDGYLYALDPSRPDAERLVWSFRSNFPFVGGPAVAEGLVLAGAEDGTLYALESQGPRAGEVRWRFQAAGRIWATPGVAQGLVYVSTLAGTVQAVRLQEDPRTGKGAGQEEWRFTAGAGIGATPVIAEGVAYVGAFDGRLYALDAATGQPQWEKPMEAENWFWAEPVVHEGRVYAPSLDHNLYVLDARTGALAREPLRTGGAIRAKPVLVEDRIVVANEAGETWWVDLQTGEARAGGGLEAAVYAPLASVGSAVYLYAQDGSLYVVTPRARQPVRIYPVKT